PTSGKHRYHQPRTLNAAATQGGGTSVVAKARRNLLFQTFNGTGLSVGKRGYASGNAFGTGVAIYEFKDGLNLQAQHLS
ncbi:hypothetical protein, partial [Xanthomonas vasicola]